jgi:hypothetical protein
MNNTWPDDLKGIPTDLTEAIRDVWHQADAIIEGKTFSQRVSVFTPKRGDFIGIRSGERSLLSLSVRQIRVVPPVSAGGDA